jgi:hypothetical protein
MLMDATYNLPMSWHRTPPLADKGDPQSVLFMRALGDLLLDYEVEAIDDMDALAITSGIAAGYIEEAENGRSGSRRRGGCGGIGTWRSGE